MNQFFPVRDDFQSGFGGEIVEPFSVIGSYLK